MDGGEVRLKIEDEIWWCDFERGRGKRFEGLDGDGG